MGTTTTTVSVAEAAAALGVTYNAVRKAAMRGTLPARKVLGPSGRDEWRIERADLEAYRARESRERRLGIGR